MGKYGTIVPIKNRSIIQYFYINLMNKQSIINWKSKIYNIFSSFSIYKPQLKTLYIPLLRTNKLKILFIKLTNKFTLIFIYIHITKIKNYENISAATLAVQPPLSGINKLQRHITKPKKFPPAPCPNLMIWTRSPRSGSLLNPTQTNHNPAPGPNLMILTR
jgi:hypothetical protein